MTDRRSQWLTDRNILSNWRTDTESEARKRVSLSNQLGSFSASPLLVDVACQTIGLFVFGGRLLSLSNIKNSRRDYLLDTLATEDLEPIVTDDYGDEITLG